MSLSEFSQRLSNIITKELDYSDDKKEIVSFGLESLILTIVGISAVMLVAFLFNALIPAVTAVAFGGLLRKLSGGFHFNTPFKCLAFGAIIYSLIGVLAKKVVNYNMLDTNILLIILVVSLILVGILAPVDCEAKPIHSISFRRKLKIASVCFILASFAFILICNNSLINTSAVMGIAYQSLTLLPIFNNNKTKEV